MNFRRDSATIVVVALSITLFLFGFRKIVDSDAWMHLSLGRLIASSGGLPSTETFVFTALDRPFLYSSAGYGLLVYGLHLLLGPLGLILLKTTAIVTTYLIAFRHALRGNRHAAAAALMVTAVALFSQDRFVDRPEVVANVFLVFTMFAVAAYVDSGSRWIWLLPLTTLLWANVHSSVVLVVLPFGATFAAAVGERGLERLGARFRERHSWQRLTGLAAALSCSLVAGLLNPNFYHQYFLGRSYLSAPIFKDEILEFRPSTWQNSKPAFVLMALLCIAALAHVVVAWRARRQSREAWDPSLAGYIAAAGAAYLAVDAIRFATLFGLIAIIPIAQSTGAILDQTTPLLDARKRVLASVLTAVVIVLVGALGTFGTGQLPTGRSAAGIGWEHTMVPNGALAYLERNYVVGRVFNTFHFGGFIVWSSDGRRTVFVDPRGNIDPPLLDEAFRALRNPGVMDDLQRRYGFESLVLQYPALSADTARWMKEDALVTNPQWALVYWDDASVVYLRRSGPYSAIAKRDEYRHLKPANGTPFVEQASADAGEFALVVQEIRRAVAETDSSYSRFLLGTALFFSGRVDESIAELRRAQSDKRNVRRGAVLYQLGVALVQKGEFRRALDVFDSIPADEQTLGIPFWTGLALLRLGDARAAARRLEESVETAPEFLDAYDELAEAYRRLGRSADAERVRALRSRREIVNAALHHFETGLAAYQRGDLQTAASEFQLSLRFNPQNAAAESNLGFALFDQEQFDESAVHQQRALDLQPSLANAHYGLALIAKRRGDLATSRMHWEAYLRLEPSGYYSRRAKQELALN